MPDYDIPEPQPPRVYRLAGDAPVEEPRGSVALAVLGEMLDEMESGARPPFYQTVVAEVLREARDRIASAEAAL